MLSRYLRLYGKFVLWQLWQVGRRGQGGPCWRSRLWSRRLLWSRLALTACHSRVAWHVHQREFTRHYLQSWQNQPESESVYTVARFIQQRQESLMSRRMATSWFSPCPFVNVSVSAFIIATRVSHSSPIGVESHIAPPL